MGLYHSSHSFRTNVFMRIDTTLQYLYKLIWPGYKTR